MTRLFRCTVLSGTLALVTMVMPSLHAAADSVKTDAGILTGTPAKDGVVAYLGIPYAAPPVGEWRWRPPQPPAHWDGTRRADRFGASCMQNQPGSRLPWTEEFMTQGPVGEDCLFLNVWTAAKGAAAKLPVMFWIYGGGFNEGSSSVAVYNGEMLARKGVIVVSVNYRVGPLGFFVHPELSKESEHHVSGNYGLLDQIAALQWVDRNIEAFGGDPGRVTIFGQSAGAISVVDLMQSAQAKGLFARAIAQSGPGLLRPNALGATQTLSDRETAGVKYADSKGAHTLAELRALPASAFFGQTAGRGGPPAPNGPFKDGWVLPAVEPPTQVPLMVGFVADDIGVTGGFSPATQATRATYESDARRIFGDRADAFLKLYPASGDADVISAGKTAGRDRARVGLDLWAADQVKASQRVYTYYFDRVMPWPAHPEFGAFHTSEVPYVFQTIDRVDRPWEPIDRQIAETVSAYWSNFAKSGDPNGDGLAAWPSYAPGSHTTMQLGPHMGAMSTADADKVAFFTDFLKK